MKVIGIIGAVILGLVLVMGVAFVTAGADLAMFKFFAPKYEDAKREVFENTQSFVHGKRSMLNRIRLEYESTDSPARKAALRKMALDEASTINLDLLPAGLAGWVRSLEGGI